MKAPERPEQNAANLTAAQEKFVAAAQEVIALIYSTDLHDPAAVLHLSAALDYLRYDITGPYQWQLQGVRMSKAEEE